MDWSALMLVPAAALTAGWWAQLLGVPAAWLRVRRSSAWQRRPAGLGRLPLLKDFIGLYTFAATIFGAIVGLATWAGTFF